MATVHRAKEHGIEGFERIVALKRLLPHLAEDASFVRSFVREAKLASMLQHVNIVQLYELGRVGQVLFISMEYIQGRDVRALLRQARRVAGPPPLSVFLSIMLQLCDALDYAHQRLDENGEPLGLVHRDVSPSNLLVTNTGHLKVIDFGIAKAQSAHLRTNTGRVKGKLAYMAPEALRAQRLDARSDIFSAGVIAHELLTARPLFACKNDYHTILRVQRGDVAPPSTFDPTIPPELDRLVLGALARDPDDRWSSAAEWRDALEDFRSRMGVRASPREVTSWMEWAFATDAPPTGAFRKAPSQGESSTADIARLETRTGARGNTPRPGHTPRSSSYPSPAALPAAPVALVPGAASASSIDIDIADIELELPSASSSAVLPEPAAIAPDVPDAEPDAEDDGAADFAWGGLDEHEAQAAPVVLADIPDVSRKIAVPGRATTRVAAGDEDPPSSTSFGAGIIETHRLRRRRNVIAAVLAVTMSGVGVGYGVMQWRTAPAAEQPAAVGGSATLKFAIEPEDAVIDVQGYDSHQGSPFELEVDAPGTYRVEIQRPGYKSYVSAIDVEDDRVYVVQMALDRGGSDSSKASLVLRTTPPGQRVTIDGVPIAERTPVSRDISPGEHVITIRDGDGNALWRHELVAKANTHYELHPDLSLAARDREARAAHEPARDEHRSAHRRRRGGSVEMGGLWSTGMPGATPPVTGNRVPIAPHPTSVLDSLAIDKPPLRAPVTGQAAGSASASERQGIASTRVEKLAGDLPRLAASDGSLPARIRARLCIDTRGVVDSATLLTDVPRRARLELRRAFHTWRYTPYTEGGTVRPACFGIAVRIDSGR